MKIISIMEKATNKNSAMKNDTVNFLGVEEF